MALTTVPASLSATALTLTTAAQPNITSVGTLTGLTVSGNIAGTLTTAAQTNITSLGTLTGLTMSGALNMGNQLLTNVGASITFSTSVDGTINFPSTGRINFDSDNNSAGEDFIIGSNRTAGSGGNEHLRITAAGNVGIGVSPSTNYTKQLHVHGSGTGASVHITDNNSGSGNGDGFELVSHNNTAYVWQRENTNLLFGTNASEVMRLTSSGQLFVGDGSPQWPTGTIGNSAGRHMFHYNGEAVLILWDESTAAQGNSGSLFLGGKPVGSSNYFSGGAIYGNVENGSNAAGELIFKTTNTSGGVATALTINSSQNATFEGNVGIGTPSPAQTLHVSSTGATSNGIRISNSEGSFETRVDGGEFYLYDVDDTRIPFLIDSSGRTGMGTTSPSSYYSKNLVVMTDGDGTGGLTLVSPATDDVAYYIFADGTSGAARYAGYVGYSHNADKMFMGTAGTTRMTILSDGKTAIGSNHTPVAPLDLHGTNNTTFASSAAGNPANVFLTGTNAYNSGYSGSGVLFGGLYTSGGAHTTFGIVSGIKENTTDGEYGGALTFMTRTNGQGAGNRERMRIDSTGNVGIGNSNPGSALHITKGSSAGHNGIRIDNTTSYYGQLNFYTTGGNRRGFVQSAGDGDLEVGTDSGSGNIQLYSGGQIALEAANSTRNIGIGVTPDASYKVKVYSGDYYTMKLRAPSYPILKFEAINQNSGNNGEIGIAANNEMNINPNSTTYGVSIQNTGAVRMRNQPYVQGRGAAGWSSTAGSATWNLQPHNSTPVLSSNRGNSYSASNKRFTCPVDGVYLVTASWYIYQTAVASAGSQYVHPGVRKNGSLTWNGSYQPYTIYGHEINRSGTGSKHYDGVQIAFTIYCSAADYLDIVLYAPNSNSQSYEYYHYFSYTLLN